MTISGENPGNADKMGISGAFYTVGSKMALILLLGAIFRVIAKGFYNIIGTICKCILYNLQISSALNLFRSRFVVGYSWRL